MYLIGVELSEFIRLDLHKTRSYYINSCQHYFKLELDIATAVGSTVHL